MSIGIHGISVQSSKKLWGNKNPSSATSSDPQATVEDTSTSEHSRSENLIFSFIVNGAHPTFSCAYGATASNLPLFLKPYTPSKFPIQSVSSDLTVWSRNTK